MSSNLARAISPRLKVLALCLRNVVELIGIGAEDIRRAQDVRQMVVESQVIVDDAVVNVVRFQEVLQRPRPLLRLGLDFMCFHLGQLDAAGAAGPAGEIGEGWPSDLEHGVLGLAEEGLRGMMLLVVISGGVSRCKGSV